MDYQNVKFEAEGRIAVLTINRPEKRNALNQATRDEILHVLDNIDESEARVLIITGEGEKAFIAGADITEFEGRTALDQRDVMKQRRIFDAIEECRLPVIAHDQRFLSRWRDGSRAVLRHPHREREREAGSTGNQPRDHARRWWNPTPDATRR